MQKKIAAASLSVLGLGAAFTLAATQPSSGQMIAGHAAKQDSSLRFKLERSAGTIAADCFKNATATVTVKPTGITETMTIKAHNLVPNSEYDVFVTQVPNAPFGDAWYQGDLESDQYGNATGKYVGRFNIETFLVAPGSVAAPHTHDSDAATNPASAPVHMYHVGIWFGSPQTAQKAGCPTTVTPFNGDHTAGIQALASTDFGDLAGPLSQLG